MVALSQQMKQRNIQLDNAFSRDASPDGTIIEMKFQENMKKLFEISEVDLKIISLRYKDNRNGRINFRKFIQDIKD